MGLVVSLSLLVAVVTFVVLLSAWTYQATTRVVWWSLIAIVFGMVAYWLVYLQLSTYTENWRQDCLLNGGNFATDCDPGLDVHLSNLILPAPLLVASIIGTPFFLLSVLKLMLERLKGSASANQVERREPLND